MDALKDYLKSLAGDDGREKFASLCETTFGHLRNVMYGLRPCSAELAVLIERNSGGAVTRKDLRPSDWHRIWPELIGTKGAPKPKAAAKESA
jgi:DNA-binding transcriptional regulator YdaS (Cro superfamily)